MGQRRLARFNAAAETKMATRPRSLRANHSVPCAAVGLAVFGLGAFVAPAFIASGHARDASVLSGTAAFGSWHDDAPGKRRHISADALPAPYATPSVGNTVRLVPQPPSAPLKVPAGFADDPLSGGRR